MESAEPRLAARRLEEYRESRPSTGRSLSSAPIASRISVGESRSRPGETVFARWNLQRFDVNAAAPQSRDALQRLDIWINDNRKSPFELVAASLRSAAGTRSASIQACARARSLGRLLPPPEVTAPAERARLNDASTQRGPRGEAPSATHDSLTGPCGGFAKSERMSTSGFEARSNPLGAIHWDYVEFYVGNAKQAANYCMSAFGFSKCLMQARKRPAQSRKLSPAAE